MRKNLILIFAGLVFFALPNFNLLDVMPDFVGAILIMCGLSKMYMYDGNFEDARKSAKFLLWISVLRLVLCLFVNSGGKRDYLVPFTFMICVLEMIYMISLFKGLYAGLEYTLMRADCERHTKMVSEAFTMSFIFAIASRVLEFAPQICEIYAQDAELDLSSGASFKMSMAQMKMYVLGVCLVCGIILGILYLVITADCWIRIIRDKGYGRFLLDKYRGYLANSRDEYVAIKISAVYLLLMLCFVFVPDFFVDGINLVPSALTALLLCGASMYLCSLFGKGKAKTALLSAVTVIVCAASYVYLCRVQLGINYLSSVESYNYKQFALLDSKASVYICAALSVCEAFFCSTLLLSTLSQMKKLFATEKRTVALPMLNVLSVLSVIDIIVAAASKILKTVTGHLASNEYVMRYVQNKARITSKSEYLEYLSNPLVERYEALSSASTVLAIATAVLALACLLYTVRIRRFTEGEK